MDIKWFAGVAVKAPEFMARLHTGGVVKERPPLPAATRLTDVFFGRDKIPAKMKVDTNAIPKIAGKKASLLLTDEYAILAQAPADNRNWIPVYVEGNRREPVGRLYTGADRWGTGRMAVTVESNGKHKLINLDYITLNVMFDARRVEGANLAVVQQMLDEAWVPTWADKSRDANLDQYRFRWHVLEVSQADWPDLFDSDMFEPV